MLPRHYLVTGDGDGGRDDVNNDDTAAATAAAAAAAAAATVVVYKPSLGHVEDAVTRMMARFPGLSGFQTT